MASDVSDTAYATTQPMSLEDELAVPMASEAAPAALLAPLLTEGPSRVARPRPRRAYPVGLPHDLAWRALANSPLGIAVADARQADHPIVYVNAAFERLTGYPAQEILGRNGRFLQGRDRQQGALNILRDALQQARPVAVELRNYRRDGSPFWMRMGMQPLHDAQGELTHFISTHEDVTERHRQTAQFQRLSQRDTLTGLPKRQQLLERIQHALSRTGQPTGVLALLALDLNGFKEINETLGHEAGDEVLFEMARRIEQGLRAGDFLARIAGDEFVVLLPDLGHAEQAHDIARALLDRVNQPLERAGHNLQISASVGVAVAQDEGMDAQELIRQADLAMHAAKREGRATIRYYQTEMAARVTERVRLRSGLQAAIARGEIHLLYQPQVDLRTGALVGVEALARWQHPQLGEVGPARFIPVAEDSGQIHALGAHILDLACAQLRRWQDHGGPSVPVSVNVSGVQLRQPDFAEQVRATLARHGVPARRLELELTESVMMDAQGQTPRTLETLRHLGVAMAIDDFGTGFSNLGYLRRLPVSRVKIDRSFISDLAHGSAPIVLSVIDIAHHLGMRVVAEGVEDDSQLRHLREHGCDEVQGFLLGRPMPPEDLQTGTQPWAESPLRTSVHAHDLDGGEPPALLIVDDDASVRASLRRALRHEGWHLLEATTAEEALTLLARTPVQVVLSDLSLPGRNGIDMLCEVRQRHPDTVRLMLTGHADYGLISQAVGAGAIDRFMTKPWADSRLRDALREAFLMQRARRHLASTARSDGQAAGPADSPT